MPKRKDSDQPRNKGPFVLQLPNGRKFKFKTQDMFSDVWGALSQGRFSNQAQMVDTIKSYPNGY